MSSTKEKPSSRISAATANSQIQSVRNSLPGKLIVIEGTDGSGKATQTKLLIERMRREGIPVTSISFPQYGKKSAGLVEEYLNGRYGKSNEVSPYAASLFYALDRFDLSEEIRERLAEGAHIVTDRYVDANSGHQGGKIKDPKEREKFLAWLYEIEYEILHIPRPDLVVVLHMPAEIGQKLVARKQERLYIEGGKKADSHEGDLEHLKAAEQSYLWLVKKNPNDHKVIECVSGGELFSPEIIHEKIWRIIQPILVI